MSEAGLSLLIKRHPLTLRAAYVHFLLLLWLLMVLVACVLACMWLCLE